MKAMRYLLDWRDSTAKVSVSGYPAIELREASILSVNCLVVRIVIGLICVGTALGSNIGDTYQQVLAEKGNPRSQIEAGSVRMLTYTEMELKNSDSTYCGPHEEAHVICGLHPKIRNQHFPVAASSPLLGGVCEFHPVNMEAMEQRADFRDIVQRQHEFAADSL